MPSLTDIFQDAAGIEQVSEGVSFRPVARLPLPPQSAPVLTDSSGTGQLSLGTYRWAASYLTAQGETALGLPLVSAMPLNSSAVLDQVPVSDDPAVIARNIYRTMVDGDVYYLAGSIADNTTTTYTDTVQDEALTVAAPSWVLSQGLVQGPFKTYQHVNSADGDGRPLDERIIEDVLLCQGSYAGDEYALPTQTMASPSYFACKVRSSRAVNDHMGPSYIDVLVNAATRLANLTIEVTLFADSGGAPGTNLIGGWFLPFVVDELNAVDYEPYIWRCWFPNAGLTPLNAATDYWFVVRLASIPASWDVQIPMANSGTVTGQALYSTDGTTWTPVAGNGIFGIYSEDWPTTPGPSYSAVNGTALRASSHTGAGAVFASEAGDGVRGTTMTGIAVYGNAGDGRAGDFTSASDSLPSVIAANDLAGPGISAGSNGGTAGRFASLGGPQLHLEPNSGTGAPATGAWSKGDLYVDSAGSIFFCTASGSPGTWQNLSAGGGGSVSDATTSAVGVVEVDHAPSGAHPVALTTDSTTMPSGLLGTTGTKAAAGNDSRLSDARTPTAHESSHLPGGSDAIDWTGTIHPSGTHAARPAAAAANAGALYYETDTTDLFRSTGSAWTQVAKGTGDSTAWASLTSVPSTFAPSAHHTSHESGGSDAITVADALITAVSASKLTGSHTLPDGTLSTNVPLLNVDDVFTGKLTGTALIASGLTGATAASRYVGATASGAPASGTFSTGDWSIDQSGTIYICTAGGSPGTWTRLTVAQLTNGSSSLALSSDGTLKTAAGSPLTFSSLHASITSVTATNYTANHGVMEITFAGTTLPTGNTAMFHCAFPTSYTHVPAILLTFNLQSGDLPAFTGQNLIQARLCATTGFDLTQVGALTPASGNKWHIAYWIVGD
jgi:hypothetical protein